MTQLSGLSVTLACLCAQMINKLGPFMFLQALTKYNLKEHLVINVQVITAQAKYYDHGMCSTLQLGWVLETKVDSLHNSNSKNTITLVTINSSLYEIST